ncbi:hypothetical protein AXF42_Ash019707 [Apostasia shenzhenica]|uniref:Calponin-homology (CH) domain-containing protein n=1 Tax=Apostasia shenzhenica TaxID=1088818 RepID=A0A2H9ZTV7_9ASPA|nr:hypothetical protein AXF42_Ash019707 [Apostasia shenzhenica]
MERRRRMERREAASPQWPLSTPSNYLRDVSNLRTPRQFFLTPNPNPNLTSPSPLFFTASKNSPCSSSSSAKTFASCYTFRRHNSTVGPPGSRSKAARRLKDIELEQSRSARKAQIRRQKELDCFGRSLTAWINFLLQKPKACGCQIGSLAADDRQIGSFSNGKRESLNGHELVDVCGTWRSPKRLRRPAVAGLDIQINLMKPAALLMLESSLREVCSLRDMRKRLEAHMSRKSCNEVLVMMSQVCKHIDEGRLKMKPHCPIVTDLAVREKATRVLMCYNPLWLQIGLHIVFGGDSFLRNHGDQDNLLLKVFIDKHFLTHAGTARTHAVNKLVGGFYRPGYYEALGNIILKRFLLLAIALDKAKCETALHIKYGIDSIDGGSPLLFSTHSHVKSSRQMIHECLSDSMHGEGDLLAHLVILGCKVDYHQCPLAEYEFKVRNIFEDLQDGVLLCRKVVCPSDHQKKHLQNCSTALKFLEGSSVPLTDSDGLLITAEDLANGDKELTCSLVWNVFVHLQVPLLINWASLLTEIARIGGSDSEFLNHNAINEMKLLLAYIQTVCAKEDIHVDSFSSLTDGRALICLIKFYLGNNIHQSFSEKKHEEDYSGDVVRRIGHHPSAIHDIAFVQTIATMLGNSPEVVDPCDIFDQDASIDERSALILFVFLTSQLISGKKLEVLDSFRTWVPTCRSPGINVPSISRSSHFENTRPNTARLSRNTSQTVFSPLKIEWLNTCRAEGSSRFRFGAVCQGPCHMTSNSSVKNYELRIVINSAIKLQRWWKKVLLCNCKIYAAISIQSFIRGWIVQMAVTKKIHGITILQSFWKGYLVRKHSKPQLLDLRHRMLHSAANVNDEMRLINRLVVALSELLGYRSISNIRNTCATLDIATELSKNCCETLVSVGAINILLKQIQLLNRGVPDQEILKHVLSTLRNIARYKHLSLVLINTPQAMEIIFQELIRNKIEGFFICCQLLRRLCAIQEGLEAARNLQVHVVHVKRLHNLIAELQRKAKFLERSAHLSHKRDVAVKKLREAVSLMSIICEDQ